MREQKLRNGEQPPIATLVKAQADRRAGKPAFAPADAIQGCRPFWVSPYLVENQTFPSAPLPPETLLYYSEHRANKSRKIVGIADIAVIGSSGNRDTGTSERRETLPRINTDGTIGKLENRDQHPLVCDLRALCGKFPILCVLGALCGERRKDIFSSTESKCLEPGWRWERITRQQ